jgi:murein DD-endopeptidase MepM/ murein hydrolase activator NlpD
MRNWSVQKVPAGKRPKTRIILSLNSIVKSVLSRFRACKVSSLFFVVIAVCTVTLSLGLHDYLGNYVYIVKLNDREVGIVKSAKEVDGFIAHLTERCGNLYGMTMKPAAEVLLIKEFRPGAKPTAEDVQATIRQQLTFTTGAYVITVDGEPFVAVRHEEDLQRVVDELTSFYTTNGYGTKTITAQIDQELGIEQSLADPESILAAEEVVALLTGISSQEKRQLALLPPSVDLMVEGNGYAPGYDDLPFSVIYLSEKPSVEADLPVINEQNVSVTTVEEAVIREEIPFEIEYVYDDQMWVVQKEITVEGEKGLKEVVYHITRENGVEVDRMKIREAIIAEPVTQVETIGTAKVSAVGTGRFIWPVEGGKGVTPGRGFSSWHTGIDIGADTGTNILAADSGVVWFSGHGNATGNYLILYHGSFWTLYLHNSQNLVKDGDAVQQGDVIAKAGSTGRSTGPHLHFEVRLDDGTGEWLAYYQHTPIDPLQFFTP